MGVVDEGGAFTNTYVSDELDVEARQDSEARGFHKPTIPGYELRDHLGSGSFGSVWSAVQVSTRQKVAVKVLNASSNAGAEYMEREVLRLGSVSEHPNVVTLLDAAIDHRPAYLVTPLLHGSLSSELGQQSMRKVPLVVKWFEQSARALEHIHGKGILHCDLKPANLLLDEAGDVRVVDFGQARLAGEAGVSMGTLCYMPPEQARSAAATDVSPDITWDIYALGATIYHLLSGRVPRPFTFDTAATSDDTSPQLSSGSTAVLELYCQHVERTPLAPIRSLNSSVDEDLASIVERCLEVRPERRYRSMGQVLADLHRRRSGFPVTARPRTISYLAKCFIKRNPIGVSVGLVAIVLLTLSFWRMMVERDRAVAKAEEAKLRLATLAYERGLNLMDGGDRISILYLANALQSYRSQQYYTATMDALRDMSQLQMMMGEHNYRLLDAALSPDGRSLLTMGTGPDVQLWDVANGTPIGSRLHHDNWIRGVFWSPRGDVALAALFAFGAQLWDVKTAQPLGPTLSHAGAVTEGAFNGDGSLVATASEDGTARVWNARDGKPLTPPLRHAGAVFTVQFNSRGTRLVTASSDGTAAVWDVATGRPALPPLHHPGRVACARFTSDDHSIVTACVDGGLRIWNAQNGTLRLPPIQHPDALKRVCPSPHGLLVATACDDGFVRVFNSASGHLQGAVQFAKEAFAVEFSADGRSIAAAAADRTCGVWDVGTFQPLLKVASSSDYGNRIHFSADGKRVVTIGEDHFARVWTVRPTPAQLEWRAHRDSVSSVIFGTPDLIATASGDGTARVWNARTSLPVSVPMEHGGLVRYANMNAAGTSVVTASADGTARLWDIRGKPVGKPMRHDQMVQYAEFSPSGNVVATQSVDHSVRLWSASSGDLLRVLWHEKPVCGTQFSPDGNYLLTAAVDGYAHLWDVKSGKELRKLAHQWITAARFDSDGKRLATSGGDQRVCVWEVPSGRLLTVAGPLGAPVAGGVVWSPDGKRLLALTNDSIRLIDAASGSPLTAAQSVLSPTFARFNWDGHKIALVASGRVRVYDGRTLEVLLERLRGVPGSATNLWWAPSDNRLAVGSLNGNVGVRDVPDDRELPADIISLQAMLATGFRLQTDGTLQQLEPVEYHEDRDKLQHLLDEHHL